MNSKNKLDALFPYTSIFGEGISGCISCPQGPPVSGLPATLPGAWLTLSYNGSRSAAQHGDLLAPRLISALAAAILSCSTQPTNRRSRLFFPFGAINTSNYTIDLGSSWIILDKKKVTWNIQTILPRFVCNYTPLAVFGCSSELCGWELSEFAWRLRYRCMHIRVHCQSLRVIPSIEDLGSANHSMMWDCLIIGYSHAPLSMGRHCADREVINQWI